MELGTRLNFRTNCCVGMKCPASLLELSDDVLFNATYEWNYRDMIWEDYLLRGIIIWE